MTSPDFFVVTVNVSNGQKVSRDKQYEVTQVSVPPTNLNLECLMISRIIRTNQITTFEVVIRLFLSLLQWPKLINLSLAVVAKLSGF